MSKQIKDHVFLNEQPREVALKKERKPAKFKNMGIQAGINNFDLQQEQVLKLNNYSNIEPVVKEQIEK